MTNAGPKLQVNNSILDSSVLIAVLRDEHADPDILDVVQGAMMSAVNVAEVWTKIHDLGLTHAPKTEIMFSLLSSIVPFTEAQARVAADLRIATRHAGLSLGDRACLALALSVGGKVYTADRQWAGLTVDCDIHLIR